MKPARIKLAVVLIILVTIGSIIYLLTTHKPTSQTLPKNEMTSQSSNQTKNHTDNFNKKLFSTNDPSSMWIVTNKQRPLPADYIPSSLKSIDSAQLQTATADALQRLIIAAQKDQINYKVISGYRSYDSQKNVYNRYVEQDGQTAADTYSARPGHSEHQTGLAADLGTDRCNLETCFGTTPGGQWLSAHAQDYGFIIRYAQDKTAITGYQYEPWHIRYVGVELAQELYKNKQTMEEFFGLPAAPNY